MGVAGHAASFPSMCIATVVVLVHIHIYLGPVHMGRSYLGYQENILTSLQARSRLVMK